MKQVICAVRDAKANLWHAPMFARNVPIAERWFAYQLLDNNTDFAKSPADFELWKLGEWDDETGDFNCPGIPIAIANGKLLQHKLLKEAGEL